MKTSLFFLSFLLFTFSTASLSTADSSPTPVLDSTGKEVRTGIDYYILPVSGISGGVGLATTRNNSCPIDVIQENREANSGLPLTFTPVNPKKGVIRESTDLNIKFSAVIICAQSTVWRLDSYNGQLVVTTGGIEGNPGRETISNWFKIEKFEDGYKLVFCPTVCDICRPVCGDIGLSIDTGIIRLARLAISDVPFKVMFMKA